MAKYKPNFVPLGVRILNGVLASILIGYGTWGLYVNDLPLPDKRGRVLHLSDEPLWIMYSALICGALVYLSEIVDHYDKRNNERAYKAFTKYISWLGWYLFATTLILWIYQAI